MDEIKKALDGSNFESSSGWDGVTFRAIRKFWGVLSEPKKLSGKGNLWKHLSWV
jgi:hypothetical protein